MKNQSTSPEITAAVKSFLGTHRVCYATPGTENHTANFYGDTYVCRFTRSELLGIIECAQQNWFKTDEDNHGDKYTAAEAAELVIDDMQFERPTE